MITISLCMIVKNEEDTLSRCLNSAKDIVDETIIVDTGSKDKTKEIAKRYTNKVYDFKWINDFSAARNYAYSKATKEYILWLDADDIILESDRHKFIQLKKKFDKSIDAVMMKYNVGFDEHGIVNFSYYRERLSKRACAFKWCEPIHEYLQIGGKIINMDIAITHKKMHTTEYGRNIKIYDNLIEQGKALSPRGMYYYARELKYNDRIEDAIVYYKAFLNTNKGWVEDNISACHGLSQCYASHGLDELVLPTLFRSFEYDLPRAEICCSIGSYFKDKNEYNKAIFWFELATILKIPENGWGFIKHDYWDYIPMMELCVCYYHVGNIEKSKEYNEKAGKVKPESTQVAYNKKFFLNL